MFTKYLSRLSAAAIVATVIFAASGCNKSTASVPDASSVEAVSTIEPGTIETDGTAETSGENLVSTEAATSKSGTSETEKSKTDATKKSSESASTKASDKTESATTKTAGASEAATKTEESTSKVVVTETTTQAPAENITEKATQAQTKPAHTHSYTSTVTKASTCTSEGIMTFTCSCGDSYTEAIGKTAHNYGSYTYNNDATYESDGTETAVCSVCGDRVTRTADGTKLVHVHSYSESVTTAPTCTTEGVKTFTCSCGSSYTEAIPATGHVWSDYTYNNDATTESDGTKTRCCTVCGERETVTAEGTKKNLPSWYDEHPDIPLNTRMGNYGDGTLEMYYVFGEADWTSMAMHEEGYSVAADYMGSYAEGTIFHGYLYLTDYMKHYKGADGHNHDEFLYSGTFDGDGQITMSGVRYKYYVVYRCTLCSYELELYTNTLIEK